MIVVAHGVRKNVEDLWLGPTPLPSLLDDEEVESSIVVEIGRSDSPAVLVEGRAQQMGDVSESFGPLIEEELGVFVAVPGNLPIHDGKLRGVKEGGDARIGFGISRVDIVAPKCGAIVLR